MEEVEIVFANAPYPGLRPFDADEKDIFFGRESQSDELLQKLERSHFISIIGTSGCGKSSLLRAGLIADLETGFLSSAGARWRIADMRPGDQPLNRLTEALLRDSALGIERGKNSEILALSQATLRRGPLGLIEVLRETPLPERTNLLVVVDQFEEIFRYRREVNTDEAEAFVALLLASAAQKEFPVYIVIAMRSEFLGECAVFADLPEAINASSFLIPRMSREQRRQAIEKPARVVGGEVESALVNRLLNDMGANPDQLPLMQHAMMRMWNLAKGNATESEHSNIRQTDNSAEQNGRVVLTVKNHYEKIGGLADALSKHADEAYEELSVDPAKQRIAEVMFRCLSGSGKFGQRDLRNPMQLDRVTKIAGASYEDVGSVVEVFRRNNRNFITPAEGILLTPETYLDISHESLIRNWQRLKNWVDLEAESADQYQRLRDTARLWKQGHAGLWRSPDLDVALQWKEREKPTASWSQRYGGDFDLTMEFLAASEQQRKKEELESQRNAEEERQHELAKARDEEKQRRLRLQRAALGLLALIVVLAMIYISKQKTALDSRILGDKSLSMLKTGRVDLALPLSLEAYQRADTFEARNGLMSSVLQGLEGNRQAMVVLSSVPKRFTSGAVNRGGKWLALGGEDYTVLLWDLATKSTSPVHRIVHEGPVTSVAFSEDGRTMASGSCRISGTKQENVRLCSESEIYLWDLASAPRRIGSLPGDGASILAFSPDGKFLASGGADNKVVLWDRTSNPPKKHVLVGHTGPVYSLTFTDDNKILASGSCEVSENKQAITQPCSEGEIRLWNLTSTPPQLARRLSGHTAPVLSLAFNTKRKILASGGGDNQVILWDTSTWTPRSLTGPAEATGPGGAVQTVTFSRDGDRLASGGSDSRIILWDLTIEPPRVQSLTGHKASVRNVAFASDKPSLISVSEDNTVNFWNTDRQGPGRQSANRRQVASVAFSEDGKILASGSCRIMESKQESAQICSDGEVHLWDLTSNDGKERLIASLPGYTAPILSLAFSPDGKFLASGGADNRVVLWDRTSNPPKEQILLGHQGRVNSVAFSEDGKMLASGSCRISENKEEITQICSEGEIRLWNLTTTPPQLAHRLSGHTAPVLSLAFNTDRKTFASGGADNGVILWDMSTWKSLFLAGHRGPVQSVTFSKDGKMLASGSSDSQIILWDVSTNSPSIRWTDDMAKLLAERSGSQTQTSAVPGVTTLAFSQDNKILASVHGELGIILWSVEKQRSFALPLAGSGSGTIGIRFSPDGKKLLSGSANDTAIPWDMRPEYWKEQACKIATRNLTSREWEDHLEQDIGWSFYHRGCPQLSRQDGEPSHSMARWLWGRVLEGWYGFLSLL